MKRTADIDDDLHQEFTDEEKRLFMVFANLTSRDVMLNILTKADVKAALNLAIGTASDSRFEMLHSLMQTEELWKYWFKRDLWWQIKDTEAFRRGGDHYSVPQWIYSIVDIEYNMDDKFLDVEEKFSDYFQDKPLWKLLYLWYALAVSAIQYDLIERMKSRTDPTNQDILNGFYEYPPGAIIEYLGLNKILIKFVGESPKEQTFNSFFKRVIQSYSGLKYQILYETGVQSNNTQFFNEIFPSFYLKWMEPLTSDNSVFQSHSFLKLFRKLFSFSSFINKTDPMRNILLKFPYAFPKSEQRPIIACSACNQPNPKFLCGSCKKDYYCDVKCQRKDFKLHRRDCIYINASITDVDLNVLRHMAFDLDFKSLLALCTTNSRMKSVCELSAFRKEYTMRNINDDIFQQVIVNALENRNTKLIKEWIGNNTFENTIIGGNYFSGTGKYQLLLEILEKTTNRTRNPLSLWNEFVGLYYGYMNNGDTGPDSIENNMIYGVNDPYDLNYTPTAPQGIRSWAFGYEDEQTVLEQTMDETVLWVFGIPF